MFSINLSNTALTVAYSVSFTTGKNDFRRCTYRHFLSSEEYKTVYNITAITNSVSNMIAKTQRELVVKARHSDSFMVSYHHMVKGFSGRQYQFVMSLTKTKNPNALPIVK
jgi:hypothetical protein